MMTGIFKDCECLLHTRTNVCVKIESCTFHVQDAVGHVWHTSVKTVGFAVANEPHWHYLGDQR